jgi:1,4-alpha-glucan branching enzyme
MAIVLNCTPLPQPEYRIGVPGGGKWIEVLNSDAAEYGGSGVGNPGGVPASDMPFHGRPHSIVLTLPPLGIVMLREEA